jgi:transposase InsO family protein
MTLKKEEFISKTAIANKLQISRSSLYYKPKLPVKDEVLRILIEGVMSVHPAYGHKRIALELGINKKRVLRVMKLHGLKPPRRCKTPRKPDDVNKEDSGYPDITRQFSPVAPDVIWTGDFTYISYKGRFIYLAVVQDRWTSEILGARIMLYHSKELVMGAFTDALNRYDEKPEYFHSDQGSEYTSNEFKFLLIENSVGISHSPKGAPWRNGKNESFFGRFKTEFGDFDRFNSLPDLMEAIYKYIYYYSHKRIHTTLKTTPIKFKEKYYAEQKALKDLIATRLTPPIHGLPLPTSCTHQQLPTELTVQRDCEGLTVNYIDNCSTPYRHPAGDYFINDFSP